MPLFRRKPKPPTAEQEAHFKTPEGQEALKAYFQTPEGRADLAQAFLDEVLDRQPTLREALPVDIAMYASLMMGPPKRKRGLPLVLEGIRVAWESDAFLALLLYRVRVRLLVHGVPVLPTVLHRLCMMVAQVNIGQKVILRPGVYIPHGQVVIDGKVEIGTGTVISPWVTIGRTGTAQEGPTIEKHAHIGTGAKVLGPLKIGQGAWVGANAVVLRDVEPQVTVAGVPAVVVRDRRDQPKAAQPAAAGGGEKAGGPANGGAQ